MKQRFMESQRGAAHGGVDELRALELGEGAGPDALEVGPGERDLSGKVRYRTFP